VTDEFVDPNGDFESKCYWHALLPMSAACHDSIRFPFGQVSHASQQLAQQVINYVMSPPDQDEIPCLHDVLSRGTPVNPLAVTTANPGELGN
jgi:hypothetical protein